MASALRTMRVDYDQLQIKKISESKNKLLEKRKKKSTQDVLMGGAEGAASSTPEKMILDAPTTIKL